MKKDIVNLSGLTSLRGIAAVLIVIHNYTLSFYPDIQISSSTPFLEKLYLWVDMFFLLSGFVLCHVYLNSFNSGIEKRSYKNFTIARFARIYPLHIYTLLFLIVLEVFCHFLGGESPKRNIHMILENIFLVQVFNPYTYWNEPSWSISAEWLTYIFVPFLIFIFFRFNTLSRLLTVIFALVCLYSIEYKFGDFGIRYSGWPLYLRCVFEVIIGINIYYLYCKKTVAKRIVRILIPVTILIIFFSFSITIPHTITIIFFMLLIYLVAHMHEQDKHWLNFKPLIWLGTISYSIYLIHDPVKQTLMAVTSWLHISFSPMSLSYNSKIFIIILCAIASIALSHLTYTKIEEPNRKRIRSIFSSENKSFEISK